jgi:hypothetical protein
MVAMSEETWSHKAFPDEASIQLRCRLGKESCASIYERL